jgi:hypothetical protein
MKPEHLPLPWSVAARRAAVRYAEENRLSVNLDMLGGIVDAAVAAVVPMIAAQERQNLATVSCPFDRLDHSGLSEIEPNLLIFLLLETEDPCPVCGELGTRSGHDEPGSRGGCVSRYR